VIGESTPRSQVEDVKRTVELAASRCHVEVTTLIIPGLNDSEQEIEDLSNWLANISEEIPLHLTRFFPNYKMKERPPTPVDTLIRARQKAAERLKYVYIGNV
jgi:pyruvate formate lyase activating enzyme